MLVLPTKKIHWYLSHIYYIHAIIRLIKKQKHQMKRGYDLAA